MIVRHPAAFVRSILRLGWRANLVRNILDQDLLMQDHLEKFRALILDTSQDTLQTAAVEWLITYDVLFTYIERNPHWHVLRHEDISRTPVRDLHILAGKLGLRFDPKMRSKIEEYTSATNPADAPENIAYAIKRNSAANIDLWKQHLSLD